MQDAHGRLAFIHILPARASGAGELYFQIVRLELNFFGRKQSRQYFDERKGGLTFRVRIKGRLPHESVYARLVPKAPIHARSGYLQHEVAVPTMVVLVRMELAHAPPPRSRIALIHAAQHAREVFGIVTARAREDGESRIAGVMRVTLSAFLQHLIFLYKNLRLFFVQPEIGRCHHRFELLKPLLLFHHRGIKSQVPKKRID